MLAECLRNNNAVTVKLPNVQIAFDASKKSPTQRSEETKLKVAEFAESADAKIVRGLFAALVKEKERLLRSQLKGFTAIIMVVGDDPGSTKIKKDVKDMFFNQDGKDNPLKVDAEASASTQSCQGCCGPGCWGCSGCYTNACMAHDNCVQIHGHIYCLGLLDDAIASMLECPNV